MNSETKKNWFSEDKNQKIIIYLSAAFFILLWIPLAITKNTAYDQTYTVAMVRHSFSEMIALCSNDVHSPLYYFIAKIFYHLFFNQIFGLKICSLVFMALYFALLAFPFRKEFGNHMAFTMIVLSGTLGTFITHNTEPRMYTMSITAFAALSFVGYKILKEFKIKYAIYFFLLSVFCTYIHTFTMLSAVLLYLCMAVAVVMIKEDRKKRIIWFLINAFLVSVTYLPWLFSLLKQFGEKAEGVNTQYDTVFYLKDLCYEMFSSIMYPKKYQVMLWLIIFCIALVLLAIKKTPYMNYVISGVIIFVAVSGIGIIVSLKNSPCFMGRYVSCIFPLILFGIAAALDTMEKKYLTGAVILLAIISSVLIYRDRLVYEFDPGLDGFIEFTKNNLDEDDAYLYANIHNDSLSVFAPDIYTFNYGNTSSYNPFFNDETFIDYAQFDKIKGDVYLVCYDDKDASWYLSCEAEKVYGFHYLYYDVSIYRIYGW